MKDYKEIAENVFRRRDEHNKKTAERNRTVRRVGVPAVSLCLAAIVGIGMGQREIFGRRQNESAEDALYPGIPDLIVSGEYREESGISEGKLADDPVGAGKNDIYNEWPKKVVEGTEAVADSVVIPKWEEQTMCQRFGDMEFGDNTYFTRTTAVAKELEEDMITDDLGRATLSGYDIYTDTAYTADATVYGIKDILSECAVAVKFDGYEEYYVYVNSRYRPETLGDFIDALNLSENMTFGSVWYYFKDEDTYRTVEFTPPADNVIWEMLLSDTSLENIHDSTSVYQKWMSVSVNVPILGYENVSLSVTEAGYLYTNILDTGKAFYIGEEKTQRFMNYVLSTCEGYEIVYGYEEDDSGSYYDGGDGVVTMVTNMPFEPVAETTTVSSPREVQGEPLSTMPTDTEIALETEILDESRGAVSGAVSPAWNPDLK